jgi:hypothetical protein
MSEMRQSPANGMKMRKFYAIVPWKIVVRAA